MAAWETPGEILRWWRTECLRQSQRYVADVLSVQPTALSNWENGTRAISVDILDLDNRLGAGGLLGGLLWGVSTPAGIGPQRVWSSVFPGESGPIWMWIRSSSKKIRVEAEWGVMRLDAYLDLPANGAFIACGASVDGSPIVVHLDEPGWVDFGRGVIPDCLPDAEVLSAIDLMEASHARGPFMQLFSQVVSETLSAVAPKSRDRAALALMATNSLKTFLSGVRHTGDVESPAEWPPPEPHHEGVERRRFSELRRARNLSLSETAARVTSITGIKVGKDTLRRFESGVGQPHDRLLPIALDRVLGGNGHLGQVTLRSGMGNGLVRIPDYWWGPAWLDLTVATEGEDRQTEVYAAGDWPPVGRVSERDYRLNLDWGDWHRPLRVRPPILTSFVCATPGVPFRILADEEIHWTVGLGRRPGTVSIDHDWVPSSVASAQVALKKAESALAKAIQSSR